eukprot:jgi/Astpho2/6260/Aster-03661
MALGMRHNLVARACLVLALQQASARMMGLRIEDLGNVVVEPQSTLVLVEGSPLEEQLDGPDDFMQPFGFQTVDLSWRSWVDQQLAAMEMLDNLMLTGCPMSHRQTPLTLQTSNPTFLTQMTISRGLGPQMYSKVFEYPADLFVGDEDEDAFSTASIFGEDDTEIEDDADFENDRSTLFVPDAEDQAAVDSSLAAAILGALTPHELATLNSQEEPAQEQIFGASSRDFTASVTDPSDSEFESAQWTTYNQLATGDSDLDWGFVTSDGQLNWGLIMFTMLCLACGSVWLSLVHSWRAIGCSCWGARDKKSKAQFMTINDMKQPLLDKNDLEVAAKHAGAQNVVCLSYEPLKSEERPAYQAP